MTMKSMGRVNGIPLADKIFWFVVFMILGWLLWLKFIKPFGDIYEWFYLIIGPPIAYIIVKFMDKKS